MIVVDHMEDRVVDRETVAVDSERAEAGVTVAAGGVNARDRAQGHAEIGVPAHGTMVIPRSLLRNLSIINLHK